MNSELLSDGNILGRLGAVLLLVAVGFGVHRLNCDGGECPVMKTDSCCAFAARASAYKQAHPPVAVPAAK